MMTLNDILGRLKAAGVDKIRVRPTFHDTEYFLTPGLWELDLSGYNGKVAECNCLSAKYSDNREWHYNEPGGGGDLYLLDIIRDFQGVVLLTGKDCEEPDQPYEY
jgi:hypothetical protein